jgi:hypothetical protein
MNNTVKFFPKIRLRIYKKIQYQNNFFSFFWKILSFKAIAAFYNDNFTKSIRLFRALIILKV